MNRRVPSESDPRARPKPFTFYPPKNNRFLIGLVKMGVKRTIRRKLRVTEIEISHGDLARLRSLRGQRCLFVAIHDGYVRESMTFERFMDVLCLLEMEVLKQRRFWGPRKGRVQVGEPIDLKDHAASYAADKRETVQEVTLSLESSVLSMLEELGRECGFVDDAVSH